MALQDEIKKAIGVHGMWKARIQSAINTGSSEYSPEKVARDNECEFGKWLYGPSMTATEKSTSDYSACRGLHADFHREAAAVLRLATTGQKSAALAAIGLNGRYAEASAKLTAAMMKWSRSQ